MEDEEYLDEEYRKKLAYKGWEIMGPGRGETGTFEFYQKGDITYNSYVMHDVILENVHKEIDSMLELKILL